jgi:hypothetical protein
MNNASIFNAALIGAYTGMIMSRNNPSTTSSVYTAELQGAKTFATELDSLIATILSPNTFANYMIMIQLCYAAFANRYPQSITAADYLNVANQIKAEFTSLIAAAV